MAHYLLFYDTVDGYVDKRQPYRDSHLRLAKEARERGELVMAGAYADADGALLVFEGDSEEVARSFAESDPYVRKGLITKWWIKEWKVVVS